MLKNYEGLPPLVAIEDAIKMIKEGGEDTINEATVLSTMMEDIKKAYLDKNQKNYVEALLRLTEHIRDTLARVLPWMGDIDISESFYMKSQLETFIKEFREKNKEFISESR